MSDILLDYAFKISAQTPIAPASTAFLRHVLAIVKPKGDAEPGAITRVFSAEEATALTDNSDVAYLFSGGLSSVLLLTTDTLDVASLLNQTKEQFFTVLISSDFTATELADMDLGSFRGVVGYSFSDKAAAKAFAAKENRCGFFGLTGNKAANMFYSFGALLSSEPWNNQQYIPVPKNDEINLVGEADQLFEDRISFALTSEQYGNRLGFFCAGGAAIIAPYVLEELQIELKSKHVEFITANRPQYTMTQAKLLEEVLQDRIDVRVASQLIEHGKVTVTLDKQDFTASAIISVSRPSAFWRVVGTLKQEVA